MKLSMHIITMNRAEGLFRLLNATDGVFDIIRVCDGGSSDSTKKICNAFGCKYYEKKWDDDMSCQHNLLLSKAHEGEWIFIMDDDESPSIELMKKLKDYAREGDIGSYQSVRVPSIMFINGKGDWEVQALIKAIAKGEQRDRFTKEIFFKYEAGVKYDGASHYGLIWPNKHKVKNFIPEPYYHYKTPFDLIQCDVQQGYINPSMQGIEIELGKEMRRLFENVSSLTMLRRMDEGVNQKLQDLFFENRHPDKGNISQYFRYYFLCRHPEALDNYELDILKEPIIRKHLNELGGYTSYTVMAPVGNMMQEWLPLRHLDIHPELRKRLGTEQLLWKEYRNE